jgi:hypothetical protein
MMPRNPPVTVSAGLAASAPRPSRKNTTATTANRSASTAVVRSAATNMRVVKMPHEIRNQPAAVPCSSAGTAGA